MLRELRKNPSFRMLMILLAIRRLASLARARRIEVCSYPGAPHHKEMIWKAGFAAGLGFRRGQPTDGGADRGRINLYWGGPTVRDADAYQQTPRRDWPHQIGSGVPQSIAHRCIRQLSPNHSV